MRSVRIHLFHIPSGFPRIRDPFPPRTDPVVPGSICFVLHPFWSAHNRIHFFHIRFTLLRNRIRSWIALIPFFQVVIPLFGVVIPLWQGWIPNFRERISLHPV